MKLVKSITLHKFPTHIKLSEKQRAKYDDQGKLKNKSQVDLPKYSKLNFQGLYNGNMHHTVRQKLVKTVHHYINRQIRDLKPLQFPEGASLVIRGMMYVPRNFGNVKMRLGKLQVTKPKKNYIPNWDMLNAGALWVKVFEDCISRPEIQQNIQIRPSLIEDDHAGIVSGTGEMRRRFIDNFNERKIVFNIYLDDLDEKF